MPTINYEIKNKKYNNPDWLYDEYINKQHSSTSMGIECNVNSGLIIVYLRKFGIPIRSRKRYDYYKDILTKEFLYNEYVLNKKTNKQISNDTNISIYIIDKYLQKFNMHYDHRHDSRTLTNDQKLSISSGLLEFWKDNTKARNAAAIRMKGNKNNKNWSKGLTKETDERVARNAASIKKASNREDVKLKRSIAMKEVWTREEYRTRQSGENSCRYGKSPPEGACYGHGNWFYCKDGQRIWLRSSLELRVAKILNDLNVCWEYETVTFGIENYTSYHPDFIIYDNENIVYWEVKGFWRYAKEKERMQQFFIAYPDIKLKIVWEEDIRLMEACITANLNISIFDIGNKNMESSYVLEKQKLMTL